MKTIVITRKYWGRNTLRNVKTERRCCLGFTCESYGVDPTATRDVTMPFLLDTKEKKKLPIWLLRTGEDASNAAAINDSDRSRPVKEKLLKELFLRHNIRLIFRGQP